MYAYFIGKITSIQQDSVILEANNIGYNIYVSTQTIQNLMQISGDVKLYTYTNVREDALTLFGFLTAEELYLFKKMIMVNGIGPKGALAILSTMSVDAFRMAILSGDAKSIAKAPGIGAKTAERLIIDLKDKVSAEDVFASPLPNASRNGSAMESPAKREAMEALTALGYSATDAAKAVSMIACDDSVSTEEILKSALKKIIAL